MFCHLFQRERPSRSASAATGGARLPQTDKMATSSPRMSAWQPHGGSRVGPWLLTRRGMGPATSRVPQFITDTGLITDTDLITDTMAAGDTGAVGEGAGRTTG